MTPALPEELTRLIKHLSEMANLTRLAVDQMAREDSANALETFITIDKYRQELEAYQQAASGTSIPQTQEAFFAIKTMRESLAQIASSEAPINAWKEAHFQRLQTEIAEKAADPLYVDDDFKKNADLLILCGPGAGAIAKQAFEKGFERVAVMVPEDEVDQVPEEAARIVDATQAGSIIWRQWELRRMPTRLHVRTVGGWTKKEHDIPAILDHFVRSIESVQVMRNTIEFRGPTFAKQTVDNAPNLVHWCSVSPLLGRFKGVPGIVVSPGPSAKKNIAQLKAAQGKAIIIAAARALPLLEKEGIRADLSIVVDPADLSYHFNGVDCSKVGALCVATCVTKKLFDLEFPRYFTFASIDQDWGFRALGDSGNLFSGGSVAHSALGLLHQMGCDPLVLVGQDLALTSGRMYAEGAPDGDMSVRIENGRAVRSNVGEDLRRIMRLHDSAATSEEGAVEVPGYYGGLVPTTNTFRVFVTAFEGFANAFSKQVRLLNCTEGGANIEGFEKQPLEDFVKTLEHAPALDVESELQAIVERIDRPARKRKMIEALRRDLGRIDSIMKLTSECTKHAQRLELKPLRATERQLIKETARLPILDLVRQGTVRNESLNANEAKTLEENMRASEALYVAVRESAREMRPYFVGAIDAVKKLP